MNENDKTQEQQDAAVIETAQKIRLKALSEASWGGWNEINILRLHMRDENWPLILNAALRTLDRQSLDLNALRAASVPGEASMQPLRGADRKEEMLSARAIALADASLVRQIVARTARAANLQQQLDALRDAVLRIPQGLSDNVPDALDYFANDLGGWAHQWAEGVRQQATAIRAALELSAPAEGEAGKPAEAEVDWSKAQTVRDDPRHVLDLMASDLRNNRLKERNSETREGALEAGYTCIALHKGMTVIADLMRDAEVSKAEIARLQAERDNVRVSAELAVKEVWSIQAEFSTLKAQFERLTNILRLDYGWDTPDEN